LPFPGKTSFFRIVDNDATDDRRPPLLVVFADGFGAEPDDMFDRPDDRDELLDFEDAWRDRDDAGADHGVDDDDDDGAICSSLRMEMSSKKFFVIVLGV